LIKASIILPFHRELPLCLSALKEVKDLDIILVNDGSNITYGPSQHIRYFKHDHNLGPSAARNTGMQASLYDLCFFIDSDVLINYDQLNKLIERFHNDKATAFTCGYDSLNGQGSFYTQYKNLYMNMVMKKHDQSRSGVPFIYGALCGLKKDRTDLTWPVHLRYGEDTFLATKLINQGQIITLYSDYQVKHAKTYTLTQLFINDFKIPFHFAKSYLIKRRGRRFSHVNNDQLMAISCTPLILITWPLWLFFNQKLFKQMKTLPIVKVVFLTYFDQLIMGFAIFLGLVYHLVTYKNEGTHRFQALSYYNKKS
jgi:glycosyltransferase involved in cell wall biosynthesis